MDLMAVIRYLVQLHRLVVVALRLVVTEIAAVLVAAVPMEVPQVALAQEGKVTMVVTVAQIAVVVAVALVLLVLVLLALMWAVMEVQVQLLLVLLTLAAVVVAVRIKDQAEVPGLAAEEADQILVAHLAEQLILAAVAAVTEAV
jgi:hypothetical protein